MMMKAVFIDDEKPVLRSIKRSLRDQSDRWDFVFESSPQAALSLIVSSPVSVVVADLKMIEMDGVTLLSLVKERVPDVLRVLLSGDTGDSTLLASANIAHLFLPKPFEQSELSDLLDRAYALRKLPIDDEQRMQLGRMQNLPILPHVFHEFSSYLNTHCEPEVEAVVSIINKDAAMTAKLVQVANSSFFGYQSRTFNLEQVVVRLGFELLRQLIVVMALMSDSHCRHGFVDSEQTALLMREISEQAGHNAQSVEKAYMLGLLHSLGTITQPWDNQSDLIGAYLLTLWGFDKEFCEAVLYQSQPLSQSPISQTTCLLYIAKQSQMGANMNEIPETITKYAQMNQTTGSE
ncbi:HDOD domain-containing protein [uncultured Neptuniibacter sp.]|uniref:HDOD domain-containing protein n=1 Tax=uncultured Neptuniibacter sp. TaxID=502143 RepID=UPI0026117A9E|nr:HDOD domain-containing protein [uncultured Neptuniibacter sp.]